MPILTKAKLVHSNLTLKAAVLPTYCKVAEILSGGIMHILLYPIHPCLAIERKWLISWQFGALVTRVLWKLA